MRKRLCALCLVLLAGLLGALDVTLLAQEELIIVANEEEKVLPDPPGPLRVRWRFPPGRELFYKVTGVVGEKPGELAPSETMSGTLTLRAREGGDAEVLLELRREKKGLPRLRDLGNRVVSTVREACTIEPDGSPPEGCFDAYWKVFHLFGGHFDFPYDSLRKGVPLTRENEWRRGPEGLEDRRTSRRVWVKTVARRGYPCLRLESETTDEMTMHLGSDLESRTLSTTKSVCYFAYEQGFIVDLLVDEHYTSRMSIKVRDMTMEHTSQRFQRTSMTLSKVVPQADPEGEVR